jgi:succinyl-CoA synthetase beta subunit
MEGTNVEEGKRMLAEAGLALTIAEDMGDGARKVVALAKEGANAPVGRSGP